MTTLAVKGFSLGLNFLEGIFGIFGRIGAAIMISRQIEANRMIAEKLLHEYPGHTVESLTAELNRQTVQGWK
jgi:hypothetical protein